MRFIADMCMDVRVATWLNAQGHDAAHLRDQGLQRLHNKAIGDRLLKATYVEEAGNIVLITVIEKASVQP